MNQTEFPGHLRRYFEILIHKKIPQWSDLESVLVKRVLRKGEHYFERHQQFNEVAIVGYGLFRMYMTTNEGEEKTFSFIKELGFILDFFLTSDKSPLEVSCQAIEDSCVYSVKIEDFYRLMSQNVVWHEVFREVLVRNYMSKTKREIEFVHYNAKERLILCQNDKHFDLDRIPKTYLASYLGIAAPSLSRLFREIKAE